MSFHNNLRIITLCAFGAYKYNIKATLNLCGHRPNLLTLFTTATHRCRFNILLVQKHVNKSQIWWKEKPNLGYSIMTCCSYFCTTIWPMNQYHTDKQSKRSWPLVDPSHYFTSKHRVVCHFILWRSLTHRGLISNVITHSDKDWGSRLMIQFIYFESRLWNNK